MEHFHLDEFARLNSPIHRFDPRAKILSCLVLLFIVANLARPVTLGVAIAVILLLLKLARIPVGLIARRLAWVLPFTGGLILVLPFTRTGTAVLTVPLPMVSLTATADGLSAAVTMALRIVGALLVVTLVMTTTRFNDFLRALSDLKVPRVFVQLLSFTTRYMFVLWDELRRMNRARQSRAFPNRGFASRRHTRMTLGHSIGLLFIRSYERGERVYLAMLSRSYGGEIRTCGHFRLFGRDVAGALGIVALGIMLFILDKGGWTWLISWK